MNDKHIPVLYNEIIDILGIQQGDIVIDATIGSGGHAAGILEQLGDSGVFLGIDADAESLGRAKRNLEKIKSKSRKIFCNDNFQNLVEILNKNDIVNPNKILFDLGWNIEQFASSGRGFSFQNPNEPLDMRYSVTNQSHPSAAEILNSSSVEELINILRDYGEERFAAKIARGIVKARKKHKIRFVADLLKIIQEETPSWYQNRKIHPTTKVFQALRIVANDELGTLERTLMDAVKVLARGGIIVVITFHSLEDRLVKQLFKSWKEDSIAQILTKHVIKPSRSEIVKNKRARSAKLRAIQKI